MRKYGYIVYVEWDDFPFDGKPPFENCIISPATKKEYDEGGFDLIGHAGSEGVRYDILPSLEKAILHSHFNPNHIKFENLTKKEISEKNQILSKYSWNHKLGYTKTNVG